MNLSDTTSKSGVTEIGLTSVLRNDGFSHEKGYSMDIGTISYFNQATDKIVTEPLKYTNKDFKTLPENTLAKPSGTIADFLEAVRKEGSIQYNLNPYYMVNKTGEVIPNFFTFAPKNLWETQFSDLSKEDKETVVTSMIETARDHEPDSYTLTRDTAVRMWDHRNHLHISETGFGSK